MGDARDDDLYRPAYNRFGGAYGGALHTLETQRRNLNSIRIRYGGRVDDITCWSSGSATIVGDPDARSVSLGRSHYRQHLAHQHLRSGYPTWFGDTVGPDWAPVERFAPAVDLTACTPPPPLIAQARCSLRTVIDQGLHFGELDTERRLGNREVRRTAALCGFQTVEVVHPADIVIETVLQREYPSHQAVPLEIRANRCRISELHPEFYATSSVLQQCAVEWGDVHPDVAFDCIVERADCCVCCFRRVVIARKADPQERPTELASQQCDRLVRRLERIIGIGVGEDLPVGPELPGGIVPQLDWLNLQDDGPNNLLDLGDDTPQPAPPESDSDTDPDEA